MSNIKDILQDLLKYICISLNIKDILKDILEYHQLNQHRQMLMISLINNISKYHQVS